MTSMLDRPPEKTVPPKPGDDTVPILLRPFVDFVARIPSRLETKLLAGFLGISLLMLALGIVGLLVVNSMGSQVDRLATLQRQSDNGNKLLYNVTAQSHFRTMALLTGAQVWTDKIATNKANFVALIDETEAIAVGDHGNLFDDLRSINTRYAAAGERVEELQSAGDKDGALQVHILSEHEISHELEDSLHGFIDDTEGLVTAEIAGFTADRRFLTVALAIFSAMSLAGAVAMGAIISWSVIRPVRKIDQALDNLATGDFTARIDVPNRDEFGKLSENVNRASSQLETLYSRLQSINDDLQAKVDEQVAQIEKGAKLGRYLSPQIADAIMTGDVEFGQPRRAELTIVFADIRGFTALSERSEPEAMEAGLNRFLSAMTDIVFKYEGTLDKYIGDAVMVFFNDPLPQEDHAERAVRMSLEMQSALVDLRHDLASATMAEITAGIGISTGFVTVGSFGSPHRMEYTVMGNHVNLASRLADDAAGGEILISDRTLALLPDGLVEATPAGEHDLKGVRRPVNLYKIAAPREAGSRG